MPMATGQVNAGVAAVPLCSLPAGTSCVILSSDPGSANTAYWGIAPPGSSFAVANGVPLASGGQTAFATGRYFQGATLYVICSVGSAVVGYCVSPVE